MLEGMDKVQDGMKVDVQRPDQLPADGGGRRGGGRGRGDGGGRKG